MSNTLILFDYERTRQRSNSRGMVFFFYSVLTFRYASRGSDNIENLDDRGPTVE